MTQKRFSILLVVIFVLAFFLRFYRLGEVPNGLYQDETAIGYNAYSLLQTGRDEHGVPFPLYFQSFGDYKLPVYIYLTTIPIQLFGLTEFAVRFPSALFGMLTVVAFYFFVRQLTKDNTLSAVATFLLAVNPWHLHYSRATFEVSISLFLFVLGSTLLLKSFAAEKKGMFLLGTVCFAFAIYTYNLTRFLSPLLFGLLLILYRDKLKTLSRNEIMVTFFASAVLLIPFISTFFQQGGVASAKGTLIFSSAVVQAPLLEFRSYLIELPSLFTKLFFNKWALTEWQYFNNVASYLSVPFFFISGSPHGNHGIGNVGQFYLFELPLIVIGIVSLLDRRKNFATVLGWWIVIVVLTAALTRETPHATRSFFLVAPLTVFSAMGFLSAWLWAKTQRGNVGKIAFVFGISFIVYNMTYYFLSYYIRFPVAYAAAWRTQDKTLSLFLKQHEKEFRKVLIDNEVGFVYTSFLFYTAYDPAQFQKTAIRYPDDSEGFSHVKSFEKFEFREVDWKQDYKEDTMLVVKLDRKPQDGPSLNTFLYPQRPVVIAIGQEISQYPTEEVAYVVVSKKRK